MFVSVIPCAGAVPELGVAPLSCWSAALVSNSTEVVAVYRLAEVRAITNPPAAPMTTQPSRSHHERRNAPSRRPGVSIRSASGLFTGGQLRACGSRNGDTAHTHRPGSNQMTRERRAR